MTDWHARKHACTLLLNMCVRHMKHLGRACVALQVATRVKNKGDGMPLVVQGLRQLMTLQSCIHGYAKPLTCGRILEPVLRPIQYPTLLTADRTDPCPGHPLRGQYYAGSPSKVKSIHAIA